MTTESWPKVNLGKVCEFKYGKSLPKAKRDGGEFDVYGSNGTVGSHSEAITDGETIIVGRKGAFGEVNYSAGSCWPIDTTYYVDKTATDHHLRWLAYRLDALGLTKLNKSAAIPGLNREDAYRQTLLIPPQHKQKRIAEVLDRAEELRARRRAALALLDELTQSIFLCMFGDPAVNPRGLDKKKIGDIATVVTGNTPSRKQPEYYGDHIEWIKSDNINGAPYYATRAEEYLSQSGLAVGRSAPRDSILITCIAGSPSCIGNAAMVDRKVAFNQQINALVASKANPHFLFQQLVVGKRLVQRVSSMGIKGIDSEGRLESVELVVPPESEQDEFVVRAERIETLKRKNSLPLKSLDELFAFIQSRASKGELFGCSRESTVAE